MKFKSLFLSMILFSLSNSNAADTSLLTSVNDVGGSDFFVCGRVNSVEVISDVVWNPNYPSFSRSFMPAAKIEVWVDAWSNWGGFNIDKNDPNFQLLIDRAIDAAKTDKSFCASIRQGNFVMKKSCIGCTF